MANKKLQRDLVIFFAVVICLMGGWFGYKAWASAGVLSGETRHDFGVVQIPRGEGAVELVHVFRLTNNRSETVEIEHIKPGCGCTEATPSTTVIEPGQAVEIDTHLRLDRPGGKRTQVTLNFGPEHGIQNLWLNAVTRNEQLLSTTDIAVFLGDGEDTATFRYEAYESDEEPPRPELEAPDAVETEFIGWKLTRRRDASKHLPGSWVGQYRVRKVGDLADGAALLVRMGADQAVEIPLSPEAMPTGRPFNPVPAPPPDELFGGSEDDADAGSSG